MGARQGGRADVWGRAGAPPVCPRSSEEEQGPPKTWVVGSTPTGGSFQPTGAPPRRPNAHRPLGAPTARTHPAARHAHRTPSRWFLPFSRPQHGAHGFRRRTPHPRRSSDAHRPLGAFLPPALPAPRRGTPPHPLAVVLPLLAPQQEGARLSPAHAPPAPVRRRAPPSSRTSLYHFFAKCAKK